MLENLTPDAVETIAQIIFAVIVLLASGLGIKIGLNRKKEEEPEERMHEIKGAIISDRKADQILRAMEEVRESNEDLAKGLHEVCSAITQLRESVRDAKQDFKDIVREFRMELQYALKDIKR